MSSRPGVACGRACIGLEEEGRARDGRREGEGRHGEEGAGRGRGRGRPVTKYVRQNRMRRKVTLNSKVTTTRTP